MFTCIAPRMVRLIFPARIMPKDSSDPKTAAPRARVTVSLPALMRSGSSWPFWGYGPRPKIPFSTLVSRIRGRGGYQIGG